MQGTDSTAATGRGARRARRAAWAVAAVAVALALLAPAPGAGAAAVRSPSARALLGITPSTKLHYLEYMRMGAGRVRTLRVPFFWEDLEPQRDAFSFATADRMLAYAATFGIRLQPFVMGVPAWLGHREDPIFPPVNSPDFRREWAQLLSALVQRYGRGGFAWQWLGANAPWVPTLPVKAWQIWNEPNAWTYWHPRPTAPNGYATLLRISARVVRREDHKAAVVAAGLFEQPSDGMPMRRFVSRLYAQRGIKRSFDALALHPYAASLRGVKRQVRDARALMARNGDAGTELWITELGWPTEQAFGSGAFTKSEPAQRRLLARSFKLILRQRKRWGIGSLIWYTWRDNDLYVTCDLCRFSGLFRRDLSAKPAWKAFVGFTGGQAEPSQKSSRAARASRPPLP